MESVTAADETQGEGTAPSRPAKMRGTRRQDDGTKEMPVWVAARSENGTDDAATSAAALDEATAASASEFRSCENCRRCKLKCSRSNPCNKCVLKGITCVYEQGDKKRGPRPGYIEELYRRIDSLEHVVLGQSLMLGRGRDTTSKSPLPATFQDAMDEERHHLEELGQAYRERQQGSEHLQPHTRSKTTHEQSPGSSLLSRDQQSDHRQGRIDHDAPVSRQLLQQLCDVYRHQIQPWLPFIRQTELTAMVAEHNESQPLNPLPQAVVAAAAPYSAAASSINRQKHFSLLQETGTQRLLQSADLGQLRASILLQFLFFGKGRIAEFWGLVTYPSYVAIGAGLHLEDHHLTTEHRELRHMLKLDITDQSWEAKETVRRLFWCVFLQDHFAAVFSGTQPSFDAHKIRRLLPCDGMRWQDGTPAHTHEFVPASVGLQVSIFADSNVGGLAYLIEATEIHSLVISFVSKARDPRVPKQDLHGALQEFLNLELIMTNWKAKLPPRYQQASYDENGYMDHNLTLAHLKHNTTSIMLYQWLQPMYDMATTGADIHAAIFPQIAIVKQAAREIANICGRFLLDQRYLVSPQFSYCQFTAARALLAYANWMMEPLDESYGTLYASLTESASRWAGSVPGSEARLGLDSQDNFAAMLQSRLAVDAQQPDAIDLGTPAIQLLGALRQEGSSPHSSVPAGRNLVSRNGVPDIQGMTGQEMASNAGARAAAATNMELSTSADRTMGMGLQPFTGDTDEFDRAMSLLASSQPGRLDTRIFSWHNSPELAPPTDQSLG